MLGADSLERTYAEKGCEIASLSLNDLFDRQCSLIEHSR